MSRPPDTSIKDRNEAICSAILQGQTPKEVAYQFRITERLVRIILAVSGIKKRFVRDELIGENQIIKS